MDPLTLIALFGPLVKSGGQALINHFSKGAQYQPSNVNEAVQLMQAETEAMKARNLIGDVEGPTYEWVVALIKLQRPIIVYGTITMWLIMEFKSIGTSEERRMVGDMAQIVIFWLFGERTLLKLNEKAA